MFQMKKISLALIFAGKSSEHEVSIISAQNIARALDKQKYDVTYVAIDRFGRWLLVNESELLSMKAVSFSEKETIKRQIIPFSDKKCFYLKSAQEANKIDVVFPVLHGAFGEDGTIQGLFRMFNVPFVGPGVLSSAVCMDKDFAKRLLRDAGILVSDFLTFKAHEKSEINFTKISKKLGLPFFVKPANAGSSIGISKVKNADDFEKAIEYAFLYDNKIIVEKNIQGREIECAVLGNEKPVVSVLGEIKPTHDFYSYEAKYLDENGAELIIPAIVSESLAKEIQKIVIKAYLALGCEGMARVDFFVTEKNEIFVNEINTIPGFTSISMYPKLFEYSGVSYCKLIDELIKLALKRMV